MFTSWKIPGRLFFQKEEKPESVWTEPFETERISILHKGVYIGAILAAILVPFFGILDYILKPHLFSYLISIRISVVVSSLCILLLIKTPLGKKHPYLFGALLALMISAAITLMCLIDQGPLDPYYAGINLPLLGFGILLPLSISEGLIVFITAWMIYFVPHAMIVTPDELPLFISNNFFMVFTILVAFVSTQFNLYYRKKQWEINRQLEAANQKIQRYSRDLEVKVKERTQKLLQSERLAVVGQLAGGIAHDFNNHLTAILGVCELLLDNVRITDIIRQDIECIKKAGKRATTLVSQLLAFSKQQILDPKVINLNDIIEDVEKLLKRVIGEDIRLSTHLSSALNYVRVDPVQLEQILLNLAINARDAMPEGGELVIETGNMRLDRSYCNLHHLTLAPGEYILLIVSDSGCGMPAEIREKIFEPFFTTKAPGSGTGLGLSSVYGIVKQTHGDILVYSEPGVGTTFKIFLPSFDKKKESDMEKAVHRSLPRGNETILLVEDEETVRILTSRLLKRQGYKVLQAGDAIEALMLVNEYQGKIDLLMTDVVLPHMSGPDLAAQLVQNLDHIKVLYFSGYTTNFIIKKGLLKTFNTFLQKPFTIEALSTKVRDAIDNKLDKTV